MPGVGTIITHFLGVTPKQKVPLLLAIARFMKTNPIKGAAWHHRKFRFGQTKPGSSSRVASSQRWLGYLSIKSRASVPKRFLPNFRFS